MLEESRMDKKSLNRSSQPQSRASAIDCKKSTELTHKPWPRNNKKREGSGGASKNETYRKNAPPQRGRGSVDRRPRVRDTSSFNVGGTQNPGIGDNEEPEIGSVFVPGSKKQNLNHLLNFNFMYPPRGGPESRRGPQSQGRRPMQQRMPMRHDHDLYLRAYCQFIVRKGGDYNVNLLDPDIPIKWDQIEEIVVRSTGRAECPICLGTPSAGRAGLCGHVYCWPCALHLAAMHDKQPPCPVCATPIHVQDMKPTRPVQWDSPPDEVTMLLVRRPRGSTHVEVAPPRSQYSEAKPDRVLPLENINSAPFAKFFTATKKQIQDILERERKEIQDQIMAEIDTTEIIYMEQALEMLKTKEMMLKAQIDDPVVIETPEISTTPIVYEKQERNEKKIDWFDITDEGAASIEVIQDQLAELVVKDSNLNPDAPSFIHNDLNENEPEEFPLIDCPSVIEEDVNNDNQTVTDVDKENQAKYFYFYQAEDGQQVFLNSLNVRILNASWGALVAAPPVIRGRVLHRETLPLNEQTRKHMPYTAHLPLYCSFDIVELDLQPPYVTTTALQSFSEELIRRARIRARHERDERRRERAYRRAQEGPPRPDFSSELLFPPARSSCSLPDPPLSTSLEGSPATSMSGVAVSPPSSGPSFAKMASSSGTWRVRKVVEAPPPPPVSEDDPPAPRTLSLSDAIEAALHAAPSPSGKKNKKSKHKNQVLFATGMQRTA